MIMPGRARVGSTPNLTADGDRLTGGEVPAPDIADDSGDVPRSQTTNWQNQPIQPEIDPAGHVMYKGSASVRRITPEDWRKAGVEDGWNVEFTVLNNYAQPLDRFSDAALRILRQDSDFQVPDKRTDEDQAERDRMEQQEEEGIPYRAPEAQSQGDGVS